MLRRRHQRAGPVFGPRVGRRPSIEQQLHNRRSPRVRRKVQRAKTVRVPTVNLRLEPQQLVHDPLVLRFGGDDQRRPPLLVRLVDVRARIQTSADRYTYLACLPFALLAGLGLTRLRAGVTDGDEGAAGNLTFRIIDGEGEEPADRKEWDSS